MAKTGPLSKVEKYYINGVSGEMDVEDIAKELDRSKTSISNYLKKQAKAAKVDESDSLDAGKPLPKNNNPVVMTQAQAEIGDMIAQQGPKISKKMADCITKIKRD